MFFGLGVPLKGGMPVRVIRLFPIFLPPNPEREVSVHFAYSSQAHLRCQWLTGPIRKTLSMNLVSNCSQLLGEFTSQSCMFAEAFLKLVFTLFGVYIWELFMTCNFEWSLMTGRRKFRWPLVSLQRTVDRVMECLTI